MRVGVGGIVVEVGLGGIGVAVGDGGAGVGVTATVGTDVADGEVAVVPTCKVAKVAC